MLPLPSWTTWESLTKILKMRRFSRQMTRIVVRLGHAKWYFENLIILIDAAVDPVPLSIGCFSHLAPRNAFIYIDRMVFGFLSFYDETKMGIIMFLVPLRSSAFQLDIFESRANLGGQQLIMLPQDLIYRMLDRTILGISNIRLHRQPIGVIPALIEFSKLSFRVTNSGASNGYEAPISFPSQALNPSRPYKGFVNHQGIVAILLSPYRNVDVLTGNAQPAIPRSLATLPL